MDYKKYMEICEENLKNSYSPYSNVKVSALALLEDESFFTGVNVENCSIGATICAERSAISAAVSNGRRDIKTVFVTSNLTKMITPCGICRQFIMEFAPHCEIVLGTSKDYKVYNLQDLLPLSFTEDDFRSSNGF